LERINDHSALEIILFAKVMACSVIHCFDNLAHLHFKFLIEKENHMSKETCKLGLSPLNHIFSNEKETYIPHNNDL